MSLHAKVEHISYTMGTRALPVYMHLPSGLCVYISQSTLAHGITITYYLITITPTHCMLLIPTVHESLTFQEDTIALS